MLRSWLIDFTDGSEGSSREEPGPGCAEVIHDDTSMQVISLQPRRNNCEDALGWEYYTVKCSIYVLKIAMILNGHWEVWKVKYGK